MNSSRSEKKFIEFSLWTRSNQSGLNELLRALLIQLGFSPLDIIEYIQDEKRGVTVFLSSVQKAEHLKNIVDHLKLKKIQTRLTVLRKSDWRDKWKRDFLPFHLTKRLDIVPLWRKRGYRPLKNRQPILLDTITAFGTGLHDTTRFMAQFIEDSRGRFERFLDIGTGTGILSLVAFRCEAKYICAIDIDPECISVAGANIASNKFKIDRLEARGLMDFQSEELFDYVAANLITHDLIQCKRKIFSFVKPGKFLAVSGISIENAPRLKKEFAEMPLRCLKIYKSRNWAAFLYQRME